MRDDGGPRRAAELARDGQVAAGGTEQVLQGADVRPTIADALDRVVGRQGRDLPGNCEQQSASAPTSGSRRRTGRRASACIRRARVRQHPAGTKPGRSSRHLETCPMDRRDGAEEHLDGPLDDQPTLVGNLRDLRRLNRLSGGVALSRWGVNRLLDGTAEPIDADRRRHRGRRHPALRCWPIPCGGDGFSRSRPSTAGPRCSARRASPARSWIASSACGWPSSTRSACRTRTRRSTSGMRRWSCITSTRTRPSAFSRSSAVSAGAGSSSTTCTAATSDCSGRGSPAGSSPGTATRVTIRCCPSDGPGRSRRSRGCCAGPGWSRSIAGRPRSGRRYAVVAVRQAAACSCSRGPGDGIVRRDRSAEGRGAITSRAALARAGHDVTLFERSPPHRWPACGRVRVARHGRLGAPPSGLDQADARAVRPDLSGHAGRVHWTASVFRLPYGDVESAGFDRSPLYPALLDGPARPRRRRACARRSRRWTWTGQGRAPCRCCRALSASRRGASPGLDAPVTAARQLRAGTNRAPRSARGLYLRLEETSWRSCCSTLQCARPATATSASC